MPVPLNHAAEKIATRGARWRRRVVPRSLAVLIALTAACQAVSEGPLEVRPYAPSDPVPGEAALAANYGFAPEHVGYLLYDLESGRKIAANAENALFIPASVAKVPTTLAALEILGSDHRFGTSLLTVGRLRDGVLAGDLYLKGGGDPLLGLDDLMTMADKLEDAGVIRVTGRFHYDESALATTQRIAPGQSADAPYNPGVSALSTDFNRMMLNWRPAAGSEATEAFVTPALPSTRVGAATADPLTEQGFGYRDEGDGSRWEISQRTPAAGSTWLPVKDAGRHTARLFQMLARMNGTALPDPQPGTTPASARALYRHVSAPLLDITEAALEHSNNLMSELIGQSAAQQLAPGSVPLDRSSARLTAWWKERLPNTRWRGFFLDNHSGLSPRARVSPAQMVDMLRFAWNRRYGERRFLSLLPIAGWKGSLEEVLQVPTISLRIWAKTGTMNYARALAGYLFTKRDRPMVFALFISDPAARRAYDGDDRRHMPASLATAETWLDRAKALEQALLERWILTN